MSLSLRPFAVLTQDLSLFLATTSDGSQMPVAPDTYIQMAFFSYAGMYAHVHTCACTQTCMHKTTHT